MGQRRFDPDLATCLLAGEVELITDKYGRLILFGCECAEGYATIESSLGFYEMNLPPTITLFEDNNFDQPLGTYDLPKEVVGQTFEGIIQSIKLKLKK